MKRWLDPSLSHIWPYAEYLFQSWMQYWHFPISWWGRNQKTKLLFIKAKGQTSFPRSKLHLRDYIVKLKSWNLNESWWTFFFFLHIKEVMGLQTNQALTKNKQTDSKYEIWNWKDSIKIVSFQYFAKVVFKVFLSVSRWVYILLDICSYVFLYIEKVHFNCLFSKSNDI